MAKQNVKAAFAFLAAALLHMSPALAFGTVPLHANLLGRMQLRTFGVEERAHATLDGEVVQLRCDSGSKPAGIVLYSTHHWNGDDSRLALHARGSGQYDILLADAALAAAGNAVPVGLLSPTPDASESFFDMPDSTPESRRWQAITIACPSSTASLRLDAALLLPLAEAKERRAIWIWQPDQWRNSADQVLSHAMRNGARDIFISIPVKQGRVTEEDKLEEFIRSALLRHRRVWSVDGDPHMVLPAGRDDAVERIRAYVRFNEAHPLTPLAGSQFDVEPYLLPGYDAKSREWDDAYLTLAQMLRHAAAGATLEFAVPYWWAAKDVLLKRLASAADGICVMDYRPTAAQVAKFATPFLSWGKAHRRYVRIAVETNQAALPHIAGPIVRDVGSTLPSLETRFSAWESFAGMALHATQ
jgi:hypothetical protein